MADLSSILKQQYASAIEQELAGLKSAYEQNTLAVDAAAKALPEEYETQRNALAASNALERKAFDERALATGLNTGTSGQAALARSSTYQRGLADIGAAELAAQNDIEMKRATLRAEYENAMAAAKARNSELLNAALYQEMVRQANLAPAVTTTTTKSSGGASGYNNSGVSSNTVKLLQRQINSVRPADQQIAVDGKWGAETTQAAGGLRADQYLDTYDNMMMQYAYKPPR